MRRMDSSASDRPARRPREPAAAVRAPATATLRPAGRCRGYASIPSTALSTYPTAVPERVAKPALHRVLEQKPPLLKYKVLYLPQYSDLGPLSGAYVQPTGFSHPRDARVSPCGKPQGNSCDLRE